MDAGPHAPHRAPELEFPRFTDVFAQLQAQPLVATAPTICEDGPLPEPLAQALISKIVERPLVSSDLESREQSGAREMPDDELIRSLPLRDVAREALRSRLVAAGEGRSPRTVYESVFLMLAFAIMVLLVAPPLVDILLAAHGVRQ